jgi:formylglycine-generating enzyme required for sulfatase activity
MPARWDVAQHWAEEAGGRLLTEIEFEYLAVMAAEAVRGNSQVAVETDAESLHVTGSNQRDQIPTNPPIRGILSGYAEWTSSRPNSTEIWPPMLLNTPNDYRIVRGANIQTDPKVDAIDPRRRTPEKYYQLNPSIGFRVARSIGK